ncbi:hypothetical protein CQ14_35815 [Bradyrhizobium lablabi]|uniref:Uncharacterized protein n=1 Tax=Bradyrhizobium lablabi TaxID=722472 RepID=A0A0R3MX93_9BRAD|nr:hypothetical protein CQ14_35815 [Bradyrhizobium lablabi]
MIAGKRGFLAGKGRFASRPGVSYHSRIGQIPILAQTATDINALRVHLKLVQIYKAIGWAAR